MHCIDLDSCGKSNFHCIILHNCMGPRAMRMIVMHIFTVFMKLPKWQSEEGNLENFERREEGTCDSLFITNKNYRLRQNHVTMFLLYEAFLLAVKPMKFIKLYYYYYYYIIIIIIIIILLLNLL